MTTLDEIYTYVPGGQQLKQGLPNTSCNIVQENAFAAWWVFGAALDYNSAHGSVPSRDFSPLDDLVTAACMTWQPTAMTWQPTADSEDDLAEQRENAIGFQNSQLNAIFRESD